MGSETEGAQTEEDDPVMAEYDICLNPSSDAQQLYVLQYPDRQRHETYKRRKCPTGIRIKPSSGFMELDMPIHYSNYDKSRGMRWGDALKQAQDDGVSSFGISGGFAPFVKPKGRVGAARRGTEHGERVVAEDSTRRDVEDDDLSGEGADQDFEEAERQGRVLNSQTLGGQIIERGSGRPFYMMATFKGRTG
jgi:DNA-directed RNA polymerase III subunit RPC5